MNLSRNFARQTAFGLLLASLIGLMGCAIGYNHALFYTQSNVGINADTKPPTAEVSINRREGVIAPTFEGGQTPPVLASFRLGTEGAIPLFSSISSTFAGGDAAYAMASLYNQPYPGEQEFDSTLWLSKEPRPTLFGRPLPFPKAGEVRPFIFGTDTSFGLKVAWSGATAYIPDKFVLGFNAKDLAIAPVFLRQDLKGPNGETNSVKGPSFLATIDNTSKVGGMGDTGTTHLQYFATGVAADRIALRPEVRAVMLQRLDPGAVEKFQSFQQQHSSQIALMSKIEAAYPALSAAAQAVVLQKAMEIRMVPPSCKPSTFIADLSDMVDGNDPSITARLTSLQQYIASMNVASTNPSGSKLFRYTLYTQ